MIARRSEDVEPSLVKVLGHGPADAAGAAARDQDRLLQYSCHIVVVIGVEDGEMDN